MSKASQFADAERAMFFALRVISLNGGRLSRREIHEYMKERKVRSADAGIRMAFLPKHRYLLKEGDDFVLSEFARQDFTTVFDNDREREAERETSAVA